MGFATELSSLMNSDASINGSVDGIYRDTTSTEFDAKKKWVIYTYRRNGDIGVLGDKDAIEMYTLYVEVYTDRASDTASISESLCSYLTSFTSDTVRDVTFRNETHSNMADANENVAFITLMEFDVTYQR